MGQRASFLIAGICGVVALLALLGLGCCPAPPDDPSRYSPQRRPEGAGEPFDPNDLLPSGPSFQEKYDKAVDEFREAYDGQGRPRCVVTVNRQIASFGSGMTQALARVRWKMKTEELAGDAEPQSERREGELTEEVVLRSGPVISRRPRDVAYRQLEAHFTEPFREDAGCDMVSPEWAWQNALENAARLQEQGTEAAVTAARFACLGKSADILVDIQVKSEVRADRGRPVQVVSVVGEAVNLQNARSMAVEEQVLTQRCSRRCSVATDVRLSRSFLRRVSRIVASSLMSDLTKKWKNSSTYSVAIHDLASQRQLQHVVEYLGKLDKAERAEAVFSEFVPAGGYAEVLLDFDGTPAGLAQALQAAAELPGFRLEVLHRSYTLFNVKVITN